MAGCRSRVVVRRERRLVGCLGTVLACFLIASSAAHAGVHSFASGFSQAWGIDTDAAGNVYVADDGSDVISKWSPDGKLLKRFPYSAVDVAVDEDGNVYTAEWSGANSFVTRKLTPAGVTLWTTPPSTGGFAVSVGDGSVYRPAWDVVEIYDAASGTLTGTSPNLKEPSDAYPVGAVEALPGGGAYALSNSRLYTLAADGTASAPVVLPDAGVNAQRTDLADDGTLRIVTPEQRISVYDAQLQPLGVEPDVRVPRGVAAHGDRVYVSEGATKVVWLGPGGDDVPPDGGDPPGPSVSINGGATFTRRLDVALRIVAPPGTSRVLVANDGGFLPASTFSVAGRLPWRLRAAGAERLPKTVYVRFQPSGLTLQDDIILDTTRPVIRAATVRRVRAASAKRAPLYRLRLRVRDRTSGVVAVQIRQNGRKTAARPYHQALRVRLARAGRLSVRVRDGARNWSRFRRVERR